MKIKNCVVALAATALLFASCADSGRQCVADENVESLKVASWNIWHGGHSRLLPKNGCKSTLGILKASKADLIFVVETYGADAQIADHLGYYHRSISGNLSIYSRYPITKTFNFSDSISTSNFGGVEVDVDGQKVRAFSTWLHYLPDCRLVPTQKSEAEILAWDDEGSRDEEISMILNLLQPYMAQADSIPIIMGGDFNSHSHLDWVESTKDMYNHGGAVVDWTVSTKLAEAGFKDSFREVHPDPSKLLGESWIHPVTEDWETKRSAIERTGEYMPYPEGDTMRLDRIDFIYYLGDKLSAKESSIHNCDIGQTLKFEGKDYIYATDHGLLITTFDF